MIKMLYLIACCVGVSLVCYTQTIKEGNADNRKQLSVPFAEKLSRLQFGMDSAVQAANWEMASSLSNQMAIIYFDRFKYEEAEKCTLQSLEFARRSGNNKLQILELNNLGYNYYRRFNYPIATAYFLKGLKLINQTAYPQMEVNINTGLGGIYKYLEDYERALNYFKPALQAAQQMGGDTTTTLLRNLYLNMGNCEERRGNYRAGIEYYQKYLKQSPDDRFVQVLAYNNIGSALLKMGKLDSAEAVLRKSYLVEDTVRNPQGRSYSYYDFSLVAFAKKDYSKAISYAIEAKAGARQYRIKNLEWLCEQVLADCYQQTGKYQLANENMTAYIAIRDSVFLRQRIDRVGVLDAAYRFDLETGKQQQQIELLNKDNAVKALEVNNLQIQNRLGQLQMSNLNKEKQLTQLQLSNLKKEKALAALQVNNLQQADSLNRLKLENYNRATAETNIRVQSLNQQVQLNQLQLSLQRRNQLLMGAGIVLLLLGFLFFYRVYRHKKMQELEKIRSGIAADFHDDLGSTLSSIALHSEVALRAGETVPVQMQKRLTQISEASRSTVSAMQDMIWSIQPQHDTMEQTLLRMQEYALPLAEAKDIDIHFRTGDDIKNIQPAMEQRKNMYLIFKEALNNTFKYAGATQITVGLCRQGHWLVLEISDNGQGFNPDIQATKGNGLRNMHKRAAQGGGQLQIVSAAAKGTQVRYQCPISKK